MRVDGAQGRGVSVRRWAGRGIALTFLLLLAVGASGCKLRSAVVKPTALPGGVYSNGQFHFSVRYPTGWKPNVTASGSTVAPLQVIITRSSDLSGHGSVVSTFTISVFDAQNATIAQSIAGLPKQTGIRTMTLSGMRAYATAPATQQLPGSTLSVTHTEYYVVANDYEYQLSTDAVQGDMADAALTSMLQSFQITA